MRRQPNLDPTWWRSESIDGRPVQDVLRKHDFAAVFQFLKRRGWSRAALAAATGLSETRVRAIGQGRQRIASYEVIERIADGLHIDRGLLGIAFSDAREEQPSTSKAPQDRWPTPRVETLAVREQPRADDPAPAAGPTLLRSLIVQRHWRPFKAFQVEFLKAARELAEREGDLEFGRLDVSERQFSRWLDGAAPRPYACRVLEHLFGLPIDELMGSAVTAGDGHAAGSEFAGRAADSAQVLIGPQAWALSGVVAMTLTVTASPSGAVRVVIDAEPDNGGGTAGSAEPAGGGARVYSLAQARSAHVIQMGSA
ncbi:helix-turn-helix domain-containing protein [Actinomycetes bacterium KLBMP 9797]